MGPWRVGSSSGVLLLSTVASVSKDHHAPFRVAEGVVTEQLFVPEIKHWSETLGEARIHLSYALRSVILGRSPGQRTPARPRNRSPGGALLAGSLMHGRTLTELSSIAQATCLGNGATSDISQTGPLASLIWAVPKGDSGLC